MNRAEEIARIASGLRSGLYAPGAQERAARRKLVMLVTGRVSADYPRGLIRATACR